MSTATMSGRKAKRRNRTRSCDGMRRYRDEAEAKAALRRLCNSLRDSVPHRWFDCEICHGIHLSVKGG